MANPPKSGIGIKTAKNSHSISYLMFADACIIFCKANKASARNVKNRLENYCNVSCQLINFHKSTVQFSENTEKKVK